MKFEGNRHLELLYRRPPAPRSASITITAIRGASLIATVITDIPPAAREGCRALERIIEEARKELFTAKRPPSEVAREIADKVTMKAAIDVGAPAPDVAVKRWANVEGVLNILEPWRVA